MEGGKLSAVPPGLYICLRTDNLALVPPIIGAFYRNEPPEPELQRTIEQQKVMRTMEYTVIERIKDEPENYEPAVVVYSNVQLYERYFYGPLGEGEVAKFAAAYPRNNRVQNYFLPFLHDINKINLGDAVQVVWNNTTYTGTLRCKGGSFPRPGALQLEKENIWLIIELSPQFAGKGNSDGHISQACAFHCQPNCALYLAFDDLIRDRRCTAKSLTSIASERLSGDLPDHVLKIIVCGLKMCQGVVAPDRYTVILIGCLQQCLKTVLPFPPHYQAMFVTNAKKLIVKYGPGKYREDIAVVKNLPNLALLRAVNPYTFLVIASQETCEEARGHLELDEVSEKLKPELAAKLRKDWGKLGPSFKELFRHHTEVKEDGQGMTVTFTGVRSELDAVQSAWISSSWRPSSTKGKNVRKIDVNIDLPIAEPTHNTVPVVTDHVQIEQTAAIPDHLETLPRAVVEDKRDQVTEDTVDEVAKSKKNKPKKKKKKKRPARPAEGPVEHLAADNAAGEDNLASTEVTAEHSERSKHGETEDGSSLSKEGSISKLANDGSVEDLGFHPPAEPEPEPECVVCLAEAQSVAFVPCGHRHTCPDCAQKLFASDKPFCPTCRGQIQQFIRIWI